MSYGVATLFDANSAGNGEGVLKFGGVFGAGLSHVGAAGGGFFDLQM
jgi:hypothetical protein